MRITEKVNALENVQDQKKPNSVDLSFVQPGDRFSELQQTIRIQSKTAIDARVRKLAEKIAPPEVMEKVRQVLENSTKEAIAAQEGIKRSKEIASEIFNQIIDKQVYVKFDSDADMKTIVAKLVRKVDNDVVWQFPPDHSIALKKIMQENPGFLVNKLI